MSVSQFSTRQYKDRSVVTSKIALAAVTEDLLADSAVSTLKVANDAIVTAKILDFNVTTSKLAAKALTADKVGDSAITGGLQFAPTLDADGKTFSGAVAFTSPVTAAAATANSHAVIKSQLDSAVTTLDNKINALGSAFNYVGTVTAGADAANAFLMDGLTQKDTGDYYKVVAKGWVKAGSNAAFEVNVNDGLIWNLDGGIDLIDNTNSTVAGTADFITVTGSTENGYQLDLDLVFKNRMSTAETRLGTAVLTTTAADALAAINEHDVEIGNIANLVTTAKANLVDAINELANTDVASCYTRETPAGLLDGENTVFTLSYTPLAITVCIYMNGQLLDLNDDYSLSGTSITLNSAPSANDKIRAIYFKQ